MKLSSTLQVVAATAASTLLLTWVGSKQFQYVSHGLAFVFFALCFVWSPEKVAGFVLLLLPNQRLFVFNDGGASILNVLIVGSVLSATIRTPGLFQKALGDKKFGLSLLAIVVYSLQYYFRFSTSLDPSLIAKFVIMTIFGAMVLQRLATRPEYFIHFTQLYAIGCVFGALSGIFGRDSFDIGMRFAANDSTSPNSTAAHAAFGISALLVTLSFRRLGPGSMVMFLSLVIIGLLTQSRSFLLSMIICGLIYFTSSNRGRSGLIRRLKAFSVPLAIILICTILLQVTQLGDVFEIALNRVINPRNQDITNNRWILWIFFFSQWTASATNFLFGIGSHAIHERLNVPFVAHNFLLEAAVYYGLIGLLLAYYIYHSFWRRFRATHWPRPALVSYLPFIIAVVTSITGHGLLGIQFFFQFILSILAVNYCAKHHLPSVRQRDT